MGREVKRFNWTSCELQFLCKLASVKRFITQIIQHVSIYRLPLHHGNRESCKIPISVSFFVFDALVRRKLFKFGTLIPRKVPDVSQHTR